MNKSKDKIMKEFLENNAYFVDFFNAYFFDGERVLKPENCMELDSQMNDSNMDLEKHVDVIRKYNDGNIYSAFIIENQSYVDMSMVVRAAAYEYVAYERMLKKSKKNKSKEKLPMVTFQYSIQVKGLGMQQDSFLSQSRWMKDLNPISMTTK